jgi:endonuclease III
MSSATLKQRVLGKLCSAAKKADDAPEMPVLERMVYAVCREGTSREEADQAYASLRKSFFDLNEIRVSAAREVARAIKELPDSMDRADRIISILQEVFETTYSYDLEGLQKKGLKQAQKQLERYRGANPFVVAFVLRHSMDGHAIPVDSHMLRCLKRLELAPPGADEESAQTALESVVPKAKGVALAEGLSQIAHRYCFAANPRCHACPVHDTCPGAVLKKASSNGKLALARSKK